MEDNQKAINPQAWSDYVRGGRGHFERVTRSFDVFGRNARELINLLRAAETDFLSSMRLMESTVAEDEEGVRFREEFWGQLDQRLQNMVSAAIAVVDLTRRLITYYAHDIAFVDEWQARSREVGQSPRAQFLKQLRNYLLHYGMAPIMQTLRLGPPKSVAEWDDLTIQLSAEGLLCYSDWNTKQRDYIRSFDGGPPLRRITREYADDMATLYRWLLSQYTILHPPGVPPPHLYSDD